LLLLEFYGGGRVGLMYEIARVVHENGGEVIAAAEAFIQPEHRAMVLVEKEPASLLDKFDAYVPPDADMARWALDLTNG
jgi:predicted Rossmann-fold nucleotide-binding protein